eukprot:4588254-Pyramimonas_sp.AAC.1
MQSQQLCRFAAEGPNLAFWHDSGSPRRSGQVETWRLNSENNALARFRIQPQAWLLRRISISSQPSWLLRASFLNCAAA